MHNVSVGLNWILTEILHMERFLNILIFVKNSVGIVFAFKIVM